MNHFGHTRTRVTPQHAFIAPDGHVETGLPGWKNAMGIILVSPQMGARHSHYLAVMEQGGEAGTPLPGVERFVLVLEGEVSAEIGGKAHRLSAGAFIYLPADEPHTLTATSAAKLNLYEHRYISLATFDVNLPRFERH